MTWLLGLIEEHRSAIRYDLLRHGYRLEWLGTRRLPWGDAFAILSEQPREASAVFRAVDPDGYDRTRLVQLLELMALLTQQANIARGNQSGARARDFPDSFDDIFKRSSTIHSEAEILSEIVDWERAELMRG